MNKNSFIQSCGICSHSALELLWALPKFPLTEKYGPFSPTKQLHWDQQLLFCNHCGHVQLGMQISPKVLYSSSEYSFRTSQSKSAILGSQRFFDFYQRLAIKREFQSLLDVGGNDLYLARLIHLANRCVIDPICSAQDGQEIDGIKIIGKFVEEVDFKKERLLPDLVVCRHVLEHVARPKELLEQLFSQCHPDALYLFEIPCFENLVEANRFDAIFHQHYHYFDLLSFKTLIGETGGEYLAHYYNYQGSCGGALFIAFQRAKTKEKFIQASVSERKEKIRRSIQSYQNQMKLLTDQLQRFHQNIYGYGASLMLATLAYHLNTDFSELICVLDDDAQKDRIGYQNIPVQVRYSGNYSIEPNSNYLITSLENTRSIFKRITELSPRRVLIPLVN